MPDLALSRRAVTGALCLTPMIAVPATAAPASDLPAMIARYWELMAEYERHPVHSILMADPAYPAANADSKVQRARAEDQMMRILKTPSRSGRDIGMKLDMILKDYEDCILPEDLIAIVAQDASSMGGLGRA